MVTNTFLYMWCWLNNFQSTSSTRETVLTRLVPEFVHFLFWVVNARSICYVMKTEEERQEIHCNDLAYKYSNVSYYISKWEVDIWDKVERVKLQQWEIKESPTTKHLLFLPPPFLLIYLFSLHLDRIPPPSLPHSTTLLLLPSKKGRLPPLPHANLPCHIKSHQD